VNPAFPHIRMSTSAKRFWPRRLLHLPSMTSLELKDGNRYGDFHEPEYGALSYTWGRYEVPSGDRLGVSEISWKIPAINEKHFTVEQFQAAMQKASSPSGLVWVDVACIDQENIPVKMDEIGKQADIFKSAKSVCVWLTSHSTDTMRSALETIASFSKQVASLEYKENSFTLDDIGALLHDDCSISRAEQSLSLIFEDPWFSSLWTLQEAYLSETAVLLSISAGTAPYHRIYKPTNERDLMTLVGDCEEIKLRLLPYGNADPMLRRILRLIERSGLSTVNSVGPKSPPMMLYSAASYRSTREPLDRVYGIMQVYNLRLGASAQPDQVFTLTDLEDQLGAALNQMSPIAAQLHVHTQPQEPDKAWRVGQHCFLPDTFYLSDMQDVRCKIFLDANRRPRYEGYACTIDQLGESWNEACSIRDQSFQNYIRGDDFYHYQANIHLDATTECNMKYSLLAQQPRASCPCHNCENTNAYPTDPVKNFLGEFPQPLSNHRILLLGNITLFRFSGFSRSLICVARAGLLVREQGYRGKSFWRRLGICS
jgi:hypothetical protein